MTFFSSSWCQRLAVACDCGIPWTFRLTSSRYDGTYYRRNKTMKYRFVKVVYDVRENFGPVDNSFANKDDS